MYTSSETITILEKAESIAKEIILSDVGQAYLKMLSALRNDAIAQEKIAHFNHWKEKYEEVNQYGQFHPDWKQVSKEVRVAKREMDLHGTVSDFKKAETQLTYILDEVSLRIGHAVSPSVKVPTSNLFFEKKHQVGCSTGGQCNCS